MVAIGVQVLISSLWILLLCSENGASDGTRLVEHGYRVSTFELSPRIIKDARYELFEGDSRESPLLERVFVPDLPDVFRLNAL